MQDSKTIGKPDFRTLDQIKLHSVLLQLKHRPWSSGGIRFIYSRKLISYMYVCYTSQIARDVSACRWGRSGESRNVICRILEYNLVDCILRNIRSSLEKRLRVRKARENRRPVEIPEKDNIPYYEIASEFARVSTDIAHSI